MSTLNVFYLKVVGVGDCDFYFLESNCTNVLTLVYKCDYLKANVKFSSYNLENIEENIILR